MGLAEKRSCNRRTRVELETNFEMSQFLNILDWVKVDRLIKAKIEKLSQSWTGSNRFLPVPNTRKSWISKASLRYFLISSQHYFDPISISQNKKTKRVQSSQPGQKLILRPRLNCLFPLHDEPAQRVHVHPLRLPLSHVLLLALRDRRVLQVCHLWGRLKVRKPEKGWKRRDRAHRDQPHLVEDQPQVNPGSPHPTPKQPQTRWPCVSLKSWISRVLSVKLEVSCKVIHPLTK